MVGYVLTPIMGESEDAKTVPELQRNPFPLVALRLRPSDIDIF
jgi:hypothetical protein